MREPNISAITILSFVLHIVFITVAFIVIKQSNQIAPPTPYIVNLVGPIIEKTTMPNTKEVVSTPADETSAKIVTDAAEPAKKISDDKDKTNEYISDRIAVLKAKKKVEHIVRLRNIVSITHSGNSKKDGTETAQKPVDSGNVITGIGYGEKIGEEIRQHWAYPSIGAEDLEAVISITVHSDGKVKINKIEKSSGNPLFDRSVLSAINRASPVTPPPYEMEIGFRFKP